MVNTDRYLLASGHRNYFYQQKDYYLNEIKRITEMFEKANYKKIIHKKKIADLTEQMQREVNRLEKDIKYFREKVL